MNFWHPFFLVILVIGKSKDQKILKSVSSLKEIHPDSLCLEHGWPFASLIWYFSWSTLKIWIISESDPILFQQAPAVSTYGDRIELRL